jgi:histidyl-tRNA synthetase
MEVLNRNVANMSDLEIKGYVFNFLQKAESRQKLIRYFEAVEYIEFEEDVETSDHNFTPEQVAQILLADAECDDPNNLVAHEEAINQIESWLNR